MLQPEGLEALKPWIWGSFVGGTKQLAL